MNPSGATPSLRRRIVVAGEFSSGKSSVVNLLARRPILMPSVGLTTGPLICLQNGPVPRTTVTMEDGANETVPDLDAALRRENVRTILVETPIDTLPDVEIIEMQAPSAGVSDTDWIDMASSADMFIWCTIASQAWRLSEKECVEKLPENLRNNAVLAVTRADLLRSAADADKIERRLVQDAGAYFRDLVFVHAGSRMMAQLHDHTAWSKSAGETLIGLAKTICATASPTSYRPLVQVTPVSAQIAPPLDTTSISSGASDSETATLTSNNVSVAEGPKPADTPPAPDAVSPSIQHQAPGLQNDDLSQTAEVGAETSFADVLKPLGELPGFIAACIVETETAVQLAALGHADFDEICTRSSLLLRFQMIALPAVSGDTNIEDIVVSTREQFQLLRAINSTPRRHVVLIVSRKTGNLGRSRIALRSIGE